MPTKVSELMNKNPYTQLLVYGPPGSGKTSWAARCPRPFYVLTEMQGLGSVFVQAKDAIIEPIADFRHFALLLRALKRGAPTVLRNGQPAFKFQYPLDGDDARYAQKVLGYDDPETYVVQTLVVDSITHVHKMLTKHYPSKKEEGEIDFFRVQRVMDQLLDDLRSIPVNLVCIALEDRVFAKAKRGTTKRLIGIQPKLFGKMATECGQYFAGVGYANKSEVQDDNGNDSIEYAISWSMPQHVQSKVPPCVAKDFPVRTINRHRIPGSTTLGSMLKAMYPEQQTASKDGDNADHIWNT